MKKILIPILLIHSYISLGQSKQIERGDALYENYQYAEAVEVYQKLVDKSRHDDQVLNRLANAYYMISEYDAATNYFAQLSDLDDKESLYRYVQSLKSTGDIQGAHRLMEKFTQNYPSDLRAKEYRENPNYFQEYNRSNSRIVLKESMLNPPSTSNFGAVLSSDDQVYFSSTQGQGRESAKSYVSIYQAAIDEEGNYTTPKIVSKLNSKYHDGPVTLSQDGRVMYFARDGHADKNFKKIKGVQGKIKIGQQGIYKAVNENGDWKVVEALSINSQDYSVTQPSLSSDGKTLYFSSNMPGSIGESDIWKIEILTDGSYSEPVNLGEKINTPGREVFPFIAENDILYFASDGHLGLGGLDIYKIDLKSNEAPVNLGNPYNSTADDFSYSQNGEIIFIASNRNGQDQIMEVRVDNSIDVELLVVDADTQQPLDQVSIVWEALIDSDNQDVKTTDGTGIISTVLEHDSGYKLHLSKEGYETTEYVLDLSKESGKHTISMDKVEIEKVDIVDFKDVYFDFDSYVINQNAQKTLDEVASTLKEYKDLKIKIRSHTDNIGTDTYNQKLSVRRAEATKKYLIDKGVFAERIEIEGVGSRLPKVSCEEPCDSEARSKNRRSQIIILN